MPALIKNPTPLLLLIAPLKFSPTHSYPLIVNPSSPFRCVSDIPTMSGFNSCNSYIILYFFAYIPFTLIWIIFIELRFCTFIYGFVIFMYSSINVCRITFLSSIYACLPGLSFYGSLCSPAIHLLILSIYILEVGAPNLIKACCQIIG